MVTDNNLEESRRLTVHATQEKKHTMTSNIPKREYPQTIRNRYRSGPKRVKSMVLTEFCRICWHNRKYAVRASSMQRRRVSLKRDLQQKAEGHDPTVAPNDNIAASSELKALLLKISASGTFVCTINITDIAAGWTGQWATHGKAERGARTAVSMVDEAPSQRALRLEAIKKRNLPRTHLDRLLASEHISIQVKCRLWGQRASLNLYLLRQYMTIKIENILRAAIPTPTQR